MKRLEFQNAVVTGGSSGIGKATAKLLAQHGVNVAIVARNQQRLEEAKDEIKSVCLNKDQVIDAFAADVTQYEKIASIIDVLVKSQRAPDLLVNSAGIVLTDHIEKLSLESFRQIMDINYFGTLYPVMAVLPVMMSNRKGHIVNISSAAGYIGTFGYSAYTPSKFAVHGLSEVMRQELKPFGIGVSVVFPPDTATPMLEEEMKMRPIETSKINAMALVMSAQDVAVAILNGVTSNKFLVIPGFMNKVSYMLNKTPLVRWICDRTIAKVQRKKSMQM